MRCKKIKPKPGRFVIVRPLITAVCNGMEALKLKSILIIENDEDLLQLMQDIFNDAGYDVHGRPQVNDISSLVRELQPDAILLDYLLPGINGGELCAQLKRDPETMHLPVVLCSAYPQVLLSLGSYGCNAFIAKPFDVADLIAQVEDCIANPERILLL